MRFHPDDMLGRDFIFNRADRIGTVRSKVTVTAFDPAKGWELAWFRESRWIPDAMFRELFAEGVLE